MSAIENDPARVAEAVQDEISPSPSELESSISDVSDELDGLCSSLHLSDALSDDLIDC